MKCGTCQHYRRDHCALGFDDYFPDGAAMCRKYKYVGMENNIRVTETGIVVRYIPESNPLTRNRYIPKEQKREGKIRRKIEARKIDRELNDSIKEVWE